jgi:integrase
MDLQEAVKKYLGVKVEKTTILWHDLYKGFGLRLNPNGKHKWVSYTSVDNRKTYKTINDASVPIKTALKAFLEGKHDKYLMDIIETQKTSRVSPFIKDFAEEFKERHLKKVWKNHSNCFYFVGFIAKTLGHIRIGELTVEDVEFLKDSATTKSMANHNVKMLAVMWKRAAAWGYIKGPNGTIPSCPCSFVKLNPIQPRSSYLNSEEFDRLWASLEMDINIPVRCAIQLLCLTGARKNEILGLKWDDVDFKKGYITITSDRSKNKREHFIKITPTIYSVLRNVPQDGPYLFSSPDNRNGHIQNIRKPFDRIKERAGLPESITIHDLRRSVSCYLKMKGHDDKTIAATLNHKSVATTRSHYIQIERMKMAEVIGDMSDKFANVKDPLFQSLSSSSSSLSSASI